MGGGSQPSNTTQTTKAELPAWLETRAQGNLDAAETLSQKPYQPYTGERIAGQTPDQIAAAASIRDMQGTTGAALGGLGAGAASLGNFQPGYITPWRLDEANLAPYMNPFTGEVETNALRALESSRQNSQNQIGDQFLSSKAFGGSRQALQLAVTDAQVAQKAAETSAQLHLANYNQAVAGATGDITRNLAAQTSNQRAGIDSASLDLSAYKTAGDLYSGGQRANIADIGLLDTSGGVQQQMAQGRLDTQYADWLEKQGYDRSQIEWIHQLIASSPGSQTTSINTTGNAGGSRGSPLLGAAGGALSGAASGAMIGSAFPGIGTAIGAVGGAILGGTAGGLSSR